MKALIQITAVIVVLVLAGITTAMMLRNPVRVEPEPAAEQAPLVRTMSATPTNVQLIVHSQGTVQPRTRITLSPEISGIVSDVSPALVPGGFFEKGEVLVKIEPKDYELAVTQAVARVIAANAALVREKAEAEVARAEWDELRAGQTPSALTLREPQLAEAQAALASAEASVEQAKRELEKTQLKAPFAGRVSSENVDVGQFVNRGTPLAELQSVKTAEIRLPIPPDEAGYADLPIPWREGMGGGRPEVRLSGRLGTREYVWTGRVVRTESELDQKTRMIIAVAQVDDPYQKNPDVNRPPLLAGLFVQAQIVGRKLENVFDIPRIALRGRDTLLLVETVGDEHRLRFRQVEVLRAERDRVVIRGGLEAGDQVCLSPLETPVDGMKVRPQESGAVASTTQTAGRELVSP